MKLKNKIDNIQSLYLRDNFFLYSKNDTIYFNDIEFAIKQGSPIKIIGSNTHFFIEIFNHDDGFEKTISVLYENGFLLEDNSFYNYMLRGSFYKNYITALQYDKSYNSDLCILDLVLKKEIWKSKISYQQYKIISEEFIVCSKQREIDIISYANDKVLWTFNLDGFPAYQNWDGNMTNPIIEKILGLYKTQLWIQVSGFRLLGIDINSGKLINNVEDVIKGKKDNNYLDISKGVIITLSHDYYSEFDLDNLQVKKQIVLDNENGLKINGFSFYQGDNNLYFYGNMDNSNFPNAFGIFDRDQEEITFYQKADSKNQYFFETPKANNSLVAIKDSNNTLFVFDKSKEQTA